MDIAQSSPDGKRNPAPGGSVGAAWLPVPLGASVTELRARKPRDVNLVRTVPVSLAQPSAAEAPVCARVPLASPIRGPEWTYLRHARGLAWVRYDGRSYWRPLTGPKGHGVLRLDGLGAALTEGREGCEDWDDWPFGLAKRRWGSVRVPLRDADFPARAWHTDVDAAAAAESLRLAGSLACIDGVLHGRCAEPVNEVHAVGFSKGRAKAVAVVPRAGPADDPAHGESDDCLQVFRADAGGEAAAYAAEMALALKCEAMPGRAWVVEGAAPFSRDDAAAAPVEAAARLVKRSQSLVGAMPREIVEAWLDLRDAGGDAGALGESLDRLMGLMLDRKRASLLTMLCWFEAHRLIPGAFGRETEMDDADAAALAGI